MESRSRACPCLLYDPLIASTNIPAHVINTAVRRYHSTGPQVPDQSVVFDLIRSIRCFDSPLLGQHTGMYPVPERALRSIAHVLPFFF